MKLQTPFTTSTKVYKRNLPSEPSNYQQLIGYAFEKQFQENIVDYMQEHQKLFKSLKEVSYQKAEGY